MIVRLDARLARMAIAIAICSLPAAVYAQGPVLTINGMGSSAEIRVTPGAPLDVHFENVPVDWGYSLEIYETNQCCAGSPAALIYTIAPPQDSGTVTMTAPTAVLPGGRSYDLFLVYCCADPEWVPPEMERLALAIGPRIVVEAPPPPPPPPPPTLTISGSGSSGELTITPGAPLQAHFDNVPAEPWYTIEIFALGDCCDPAHWVVPPYTIDPPRSSDTITLLAPTVFPTTGGLYEVNLVFCCSQESDPRVPVGSGPLLRIEATSLTIGGVGTGGVVTVRPNHSSRVQLHNVPDAGYGVQFRRFGGVNAEQDVVPVGFGDPAVDWTAPDAPDGGQFHVRLVKVASGQILLDGPAVSVPVYMPTVSSPPGSGERLTPITVQGGASVRVQVSAAAHDDGDRVMLVPAGGELTQAVASDLLNRAPDVNVGGVPFYWATFTLSAAGAYDVVFVAPDGIRLATGPRITVEAPPPPPPPAAELTINGVGASGAIHVAPGAPLAVTFAHVPVDWGYSLEIYETNQCCAGSPAALIYTIAPPQDSGTVTMTAPTAVLPGGRSYDLFLVYCCADPAEIPPEAERLALAVGPRLIVDPPAPGATVNPTVTFTINQVGQGQELRAAAGDPLAVAISGDAAQGPLHRLDAVLLRRSEPGQPGTVRVYLDGTPTPPTSDSQPLPIWFSMAGPALDGEYDAILVQTDSGGTPVREVSGPHLVIGTGGAPAPPGTDDLYFFDTDAVGSVRQITTMTPGQRWWKDYQPFGLETGENASTGGTADEIGFAGTEIDPSGMNYVGARYYQSQTGRFTSVDPLGVNPLWLVNPQRMNLYTYGLNNPFTYVDPDGRDAIVVNFSTGAQISGHQFGHNGIIAVHSDGSATFADFGPINQGVAESPGIVNTLILPRVAFGANGLPTRASFMEISAALAKASGRPADSIRLAYFKTSEADTAKLDAWVNYTYAKSRSREGLTYNVFSQNCGHYCLTGLGIAQGRGEPPAGGFSFPNFDFWILKWLADTTYQMKATVATSETYCVAGQGDCR